MSGSLWGWWLLLSPLSAQAEFQRLARPSSDITQCPVQPRVRYQHCLHLVSSGSHAHGTGCQTVGRWLWYKFRALCFLCPLKLHTFPEAALPGTVSLKETWKLFSFLFEKKKKNLFWAHLLWKAIQIQWLFFHKANITGPQVFSKFCRNLFCLSWSSRGVRQERLLQLHKN